MEIGANFASKKKNGANNLAALSFCFTGLNAEHQC
jgi:hypothetical protein